MKQLNRTTTNLTLPYPEKVVQFGAGNFLRAFADWVINRLNEETEFAGSVVVVKASSNTGSSTTYDKLNAQDGLYHLILTGSPTGEAVSDTQLIHCISRTINPYLDYNAYTALARQSDIRFIVSNTTEAGIQLDPNDHLEDQPPNSFPAKLTTFLYERFQYFEGANDKGCIILPCELIKQNGDTLKQCVLQCAEKWQLPSEFSIWVNNSNYFCNTLVDRIVPGFPHERAIDIQQEIGFTDTLLVEGELYHSWIIEAPNWVQAEFPAPQIGLNVKFVEDAAPYRKLKVRILNGAHTAMVPVGYLYGLRSVREGIEDEVVGRFITNLLYEDVLPVLDFPSAEREQMAQDVLQRFRNPFLYHQLITISLNSTAKFKTRLLPSLLDYVAQFGKPPQRICLALAALIRFYKGDWAGEQIALKDDPEVLTFWQEVWRADLSGDQRVTKILREEALWGQDLSQIPQLQSSLTHYLTLINTVGLQTALEHIE